MYRVRPYSRRKSRSRTANAGIKGTTEQHVWESEAMGNYFCIENIRDLAMLRPRGFHDEVVFEVVFEVVLFLKTRSENRSKTTSKTVSAPVVKHPILSMHLPATTLNVALSSQI
jgi:hypothetical protein